jgi:hypothetical protein
MQNMANKNICPIGLLWMWIEHQAEGKHFISINAKFFIPVSNFYSRVDEVLHFWFRQEGMWLASTDGFLVSPFAVTGQRRPLVKTLALGLLFYLVHWLAVWLLCLTLGCTNISVKWGLMIKISYIYNIYIYNVQDYYEH